MSPLLAPPSLPRDLASALVGTVPSAQAARLTARRHPRDADSAGLGG